jgi:predicted flap endonuclease-1-like 5' DNA nuclease
METKKKIEALVISPAKDGHKRIAKGFSLSEIKESGKSINDLIEYGICIDYMRKSSHEENIELLKKLKPLDKKAKPREPFTFKEKKRTTFKVEEEKPKIVQPKVKKEKGPIKKEKVKAPKKEVIKEEIAQQGTPLSSLSGFGPATASKFKELGVETIEQLIKEDPSELKALLKGVSEERIKKWIEEGKELLK